jgi:drug/metabolite transporter (DMT)-like permease
MFSTSLLWAAGFIAMGSILQSINAMSLLFYRYFLLLVVLVPIIFKTEKFVLPSKQNIWPILGMAFFNVLVLLLMFEAYKTTTGTNVAVISAMNPLTIALWSFVFLKTHFKLIQVFGALLAFFGVLIMIFKGDLSALVSLQFHIGDLLMLLVTLSFGLSAICSRSATKTISPLNAVFYSTLIGLLLMLPFIIPDFQLPGKDLKLILLIFFVGAFSTAITQWFFNVSVKYLGAAESGIIINFNPVFGMLISWIFLNQTPVVSQLVGWLIIMGGIILFYKNQLKR